MEDRQGAALIAGGGREEGCRSAAPTAFVYSGHRMRLASRAGFD
jgi:hypothetical protein